MDALKKNAHDQNEQTRKMLLCHQLTRITDVLNKHAHDQNEQTIEMLCMSPSHTDYGCVNEECTLPK